MRKNVAKMKSDFEAALELLSDEVPFAGEYVGKPSFSLVNVAFSIQGNVYMSGIVRMVIPG